MKIKLDSKMSAGAEGSLGRHAVPLYEQQGKHIVGVIEMAHIERTQPAPDADKEASVKLRVVGLEIATTEQEPALRDAARALYLCRTAQGTLDADGEIELSKATIDLASGRLLDLELARLRVLVNSWHAHTCDVIRRPKLTNADLLAELRRIRDGLAAGTYGTDPER